MPKINTNNYYDNFLCRPHLTCPDTTDRNDGISRYMNIRQKQSGNPILHLFHCQLIASAIVGLVKLSDSDNQPSILKYCYIIGKCNEGWSP